MLKRTVFLIVTSCGMAHGALLRVAVRAVNTGSTQRFMASSGLKVRTLKEVADRGAELIQHHFLKECRFFVATMHAGRTDLPLTAQDRQKMIEYIVFVENELEYAQRAVRRAQIYAEYMKSVIEKCSSNK